MGLVKLCRGDMFVGHPQAIAHGCNLKGAMGAGVAIHFKEKFPEMYELYREACEQKKLSLGDIFIYNGEMNNGKVRVYNLMTQEGFNGADLNALHDSIFAMCKDADENNISEITMPLIGSGYGMVTPSTIINFLFEAAVVFRVNLNVVVQVCDNKFPLIIMERRPDPNRPVPVKQ